ncbi:5454_t:CDS:2 [Funneliformis caledonium]|uniref:5454_t:CDS:1 n=1 Tax=Funneliformis caledonium TaxID=1117310 RepID=A0A9N9C8A1_9GLOM|nr:5454_t:CDS:2 [Funneliformis caledonium]
MYLNLSKPPHRSMIKEKIILKLDLTQKLKLIVKSDFLSSNTLYHGPSICIYTWKHQQKALTTAIIDGETGEISMSDSPHPTAPTPLPHAFLRDDEISQHSSITIEPARSLPLYKISTLHKTFN